MGKVNDEDELDQDEGQTADESKVHPSVAKSAMGDKESSNDAADNEEILEAPESVLETGPRVATTPNSYHEEGHQQEEEGDDEADTVDSQVADGVGTLHLHVELVPAWYILVKAVAYGQQSGLGLLTKGNLKNENV